MMATTEDSAGPARCDFTADCDERADYALDVAVADADIKEIPVCAYHAERVCDFSVGFSGLDVRDLDAGERSEGRLVTDGGQYHCRWTGECRDCEKPVSTRTEGSGESEHHVRVRCADCGATNYLTEREELGPLRADGGREMHEISAPEHYKRRFESAGKDRALFVGLLVGFVAGLLWEAVRR